MTSMQRVAIYPGQIAIETADIPAPGPSEALVRTLVAGVCGSDLHAARGRHPFVALPYRPGHEVVGIVEATGSGAAGTMPGQRVTVAPYLPCWSCKMCTSGRENLCENLGFFGCGYLQGGMAEHFTVPADRLFPVPGALDDHAAALIDRATALGADAAIDARTPDVAAQVRDVLGGSADVVFDCAAVQSSMDQAIAIADKGGTVVVVGVPAQDVTVPLPIIQDHQIRIQGSATYLPEDFTESVELLRAGVVKPADFVTATRPLARVAEAFELASSGNHVKVLVTVGER